MPARRVTTIARHETTSPRASADGMRLRRVLFAVYIDRRRAITRRCFAVRATRCRSVACQRKDAAAAVSAHNAVRRARCFTN